MCGRAQSFGSESTSLKTPQTREKSARAILKHVLCVRHMAACTHIAPFKAIELTLTLTRVSGVEMGMATLTLTFRRTEHRAGARSEARTRVIRRLGSAFARHGLGVARSPSSKSNPKLGSGRPRAPNNDSQSWTGSKTADFENPSVGNHGSPWGKAEPRACGSRKASANRHSQGCDCPKPDCFANRFSFWALGPPSSCWRDGRE